MATNRITVQIIGAKEDKTDVRFADFLKQLEAIEKALIETDRIVSEGKSAYFRVSDLHHDSPASVEIEGVSIEADRDYTIPLLDTFFGGLKAIQNGNEPRGGFDYDTLTAYKSLVAYNGTSIQETIIKRDDEILSLSRTLPEAIERLLGPDIFEEGSITGKLDAINLHTFPNSFTVYPPVRLPKLKCVFPKELREDAVRAVDRYVQVYGRMKFKKRDSFPYEMQVREIEVFRPSEELPTLRSLRGIAPDATGGKTATDFIRDNRENWDR